MAETEVSTESIVMEEEVKTEIHEELHIAEDHPPEYSDDADDVSAEQVKSFEAPEQPVQDANDLHCQEVLMDVKDDVEMGAEVEVGAEPPRKRGRGRPKGSTSQQRVHHIKTTTTLRSSPRYEALEERSNSLNSPPQQSCPDIIAHTVTSPFLPLSTPPSGKRGRGRPPKVRPPPISPEDQVAQINHHMNNLNEVMNNPLLTQPPASMMMTPHQILLQQHQLFEHTRRLIQQQQLLLAQHKQVALAASNPAALLSTGLLGHPGGDIISPFVPSNATVPSSETKRGRGRPKGSGSAKPPKVPKMKTLLNADGTPKQKRPYKKRQPKSESGEETPRVKRKYTKRSKNGAEAGDKSSNDPNAPVVKEKGKRGRKPKNQSAGQLQSDDKTLVKKQRKQKEKKPREKKPRKGKSKLSVTFQDRDSDGGSSTDSVVFCSEEPPPPIMSSPTYNSNSGSSNSRQSNSNNNNHKAIERSLHSGLHGEKNSVSTNPDDSSKHKKPSSPVVRRLEDSSSDSSSGSSSSDDSESSSSDGDSSSSSSDDEGNNNDGSSSGRSRSPSPSLVNKKLEDGSSTINTGDYIRDYNVRADGPQSNTNGEYHNRRAESPSWWYSSHNNDSGDSESDEEGDSSRKYNSNSPPPRSPSSASSESPDKSYQCHLCRKWFSSPVTLRIHKRSHQAKPNSGGSGSGGRAPRRYECDCCDATFTRRERLELHRSEKHLGTLTERCEVCGRGFEDEEQQKKHLATHTADERAGRCTDCGSTYSSWDQLRRHRATHTPPASYVCNLCRKSFTYSHSLSRHLSNHSKAVYRCVVCKMSFNDYNSLEKHLNSHLDRYKQLKTT